MISESDPARKPQLVENIYEFGPFRLEPAQRQLLRNGQPVALSPKAFDTLVVLVQHSGHALKKEDLLQFVWPDAFVEESNLNHNISVIRKALSEANNGNGYIETVRGYGFRFKAEVHTPVTENVSVLVHRRTRTEFVLKEETREEQRHTQINGVVDTGRWSRSARLMVGVLGMTLVTVTVWAGLRLRASESKPTATVPAPVIRSVAVLPFTILNAGNDDSYLGLGMADALITKLGRIKQVRIRPTSAIQKYAGVDHDPVRTGRELNVDAILDGRIHKAGERVRVTVQLLSVKDGTPLWTENFDGKLSDIFNVQDSISGRVARAVAPNLTSEDFARLGKRVTDNEEAYRAYLKGRFFWNKRTADNSVKSIEYFQQAIEIDPKFALAYAGLADAYNYGPYTRSRKGALVKAAAEKALAIDDSLADAHATLANISFFDDWDWPEAERRFHRAIELNPDHATTHHWYAYFLAARGRLDEALTAIKRAQELEPLSLIINTDVGQLLHFARRDHEAIEQLQKTLEMDPNFVMAHHRLAEIYVRQGRYDEAIAEFQKVGPGYGSGLPLPALIGHPYALSGNQDEARRILALVAQRSKEGTSAAPKPVVALIHADLGETDQAFAWLDQALAEKDVELILIKSNPLFDSLRSDPRFQELMRRMDLS